jgi:hypothetical protein
MYSSLNLRIAKTVSDEIDVLSRTTEKAIN